jgi:hypothetical protein
MAPTNASERCIYFPVAVAISPFVRESYVMLMISENVIESIPQGLIYV